VGLTIESTAWNWRFHKIYGDLSIQVPTEVVPRGVSAHQAQTPSDTSMEGLHFGTEDPFSLRSWRYWARVAVSISGDALQCRSNGGLAVDNTNGSRCAPEPLDVHYRLRFLNAMRKQNELRQQQ
jgi:hypothetical protein